MKPEDFGITIYKWNNGKLDCFQNVNLSCRRLTKLPLNFGIVEGHFDCSHNNLTSLEGCPSSVKGSFFCDYNHLTSLEGCPSSVGGSFCRDNNKVEFTYEHIKREMLRSKLKDKDIKDSDLDNLAAIRSLFNK